MGRNEFSFEVTVQLSEDVSCGVGTIGQEIDLSDECPSTGVVFLQKNDLGWPPGYWPRVLVVEAWGKRLSAIRGCTGDDQQIQEITYTSGLGDTIVVVQKEPDFPLLKAWLAESKPPAIDDDDEMDF